MEGVDHYNEPIGVYNFTNTCKSYRRGKQAMRIRKVIDYMAPKCCINSLGLQPRVVHDQAGAVVIWRTVWMDEDLMNVVCPIF